MKLIHKFDSLVIDLDGVVYIGEKPIPGVVETTKALRELNKGMMFLTNDSRSSSGDFAKKLQDMGIAASPKEILTSGMALAHYLKESYKLEGKTAFVVGSLALKEEIRRIGLRIIEGDKARKADFVIVGGHPNFNYKEMKLASLAIQNGALFFGTNRDANFPTPQGLLPATGAILTSIEVASGKRAMTVGKPEPIMMEVAKSLLPSSERIALVGDRLDTDILGGKRTGLTTILVLSGITSRNDLAKSEVTPDYVIDNLAGLLKDFS